MKTLIVFYSKTGNTKKVGIEISKILNADVDEIIDNKKRSGILGFILGGRDALRKKPTTIQNQKDPSNYDLVVIGTPNWASTMVPAVRTYLTKYKLKKAAFYCTFGGNVGTCFKEMESLSSKPLATLALKDKEVNNSFLKIKEFCLKLK